jgi:hypothetical protein
MKTAKKITPEPKRVRQLRALRDVLKAQQAALLAITEYLERSPAPTSGKWAVKEAGTKLANFLLETEGDLPL